MDERVECTHCRVLMTSWAAPGSSVRYWQCPFCRRTCSSAYGESFGLGGGARRLPRAASPVPGAAPGLPQPSAEERSRAVLRARAQRWFARLEAEERPAPPRPPARVSYEPAAVAAGAAVLARPGQAR